MLELKNDELRLTIKTKTNKNKTYVQTKVPIKRAIEYSEGEMSLFEDAVKQGRDGASETELLDYRIGFLANIFDDEDVTKELLMEELDANERKTLYDIINKRVFGNDKEETESTTDPKK